jgi:multiple sugar transport system permease protein
MTSLKSAVEISSQQGSPWMVHHPTVENFWYLLTYPNFHYYLNSVTITIATVVVSMVISVLAAFSLARMGFWDSITHHRRVPDLPGSRPFQVGFLDLINSV